jgi:hypothetical protein
LLAVRASGSLISKKVYVGENIEAIYLLASIEERNIEGISDRSDRIYRQPSGGSPGATRSPSPMSCSEYKPFRVDKGFAG